MLTALGLLGACSGGDNSDPEFDAYFGLLAPEMASLELDLAALTQAGLDVEGEALAANQLAFRDTLDAAATRIGGLDPPGELLEPHDELIVATRDLADVSEREAALTSDASPAFDAGEVAAQGLSRAADWYAACHDLQDAALVRDIDVDLKCVTTLQGGAGP